MKRTLLAALVVLVGLCSISSLAFAEPERLTDHFSVSWFDDQGNESSLPVALIYAHEDFRYADGILHFMPLKLFFVHDYKPPVVIRSERPVYQVNYDSWFFDSFSEAVTFYQAYKDDFHRMSNKDGETADISSLSPGDYLLEIRIIASKGEYYFSGAGFIHLIVPGSETSFWPVPDEQSVAQTPDVLPETTPEPSF